MTQYLMIARQSIIIGVTLMMMPVEFIFDIIEDELERRGIEL